VPNESDNLVSLHIDGREVAVPKGTMILEAARALGIDIPIFCYHKHMIPVGMCRMCMVEVEGWPKPATACNTAVAPEMKVITDSPTVIAARRGIIEFLLVNHPLDCPICDRGGECPLQDNTMDWGAGETRFVDEKRHFRKAARLGPFIVLDMERCIHCGRCIRLMKEVAGEHKIEFMERGARTEIHTFNDEPLIAKFTGNAVEACPTGAFTSAVYRFQARPWDIEQFGTVCSFCSVGCNMTATVRDQSVVRHLVAENKKVSQTWLCDKGRFVHHFVESEKRLAFPAVRSGEKFKQALWPDALRQAGDALAGVIEKYGPQAVGGIGGARSGLEDAYLFNRFLREVVKTRNVDHRLTAQKSDWRNPVMESFGTWSMTCTIGDIDRAGAILVVGSDTMEEHPVIGLRIRQAATKNGTHLTVAAPMATHMAGAADLDIRIKPGAEAAFVQAIARAIIDTDTYDTDAASKIAGWDVMKSQAADALAAICGVTVDQIRAAAEAFAKAEYKIVVFEKPVLDAPTPDAMQAIVNLALLCGSVGLMGLVEHNNTMGAIAAGLLPDGGMSTREMLEAAANGKLKALVLMGANPIAHFPDRALAEKALANLECLIVIDLFPTECAGNAQFLFPAQSCAERDGIYVNCEGRMHAFRGVVPPYRETKSDGEIIIGLANAMGAGWTYETLDQVRESVKTGVPEYAPELVATSLEQYGGYRVYHSSAGKLPSPRPNGGNPSYAAVAVDQVDPPKDYPYPLIIRKMLFDTGTLMAATSAAIATAGPARCYLAKADAAAIGIADGDKIRVTSPAGSIVVTAVVSGAVAASSVYVPEGFTEAAVNTLQRLGDTATFVRIEKA
jgi:NADH-quinone oxidoreductase subunit G